MPKIVKPEIRIPENFAALGCQFPDITVRQRLYLGLDAQTKAGTTHFALGFTKAKQMVYVNINKGTMGVIQKFNYRRVIEKKIDFTKNQDEATAAFMEFEAVWLEALRNDIPIVVDKWTEIWQLACVSAFGDKHPKSIHYAPLNSVILAMMKPADDSGSHIILLSSLTDEYVDDKSTGAFVRQGFKKTEAKVEINARLAFDPHTKVRSLTIENNRWDSNLAGLVLENENASIEGLGKRIFGEDWQI